MSATVLAQETATARARAIKALLRRPLLDRTHQDDFVAVVTHAQWLQRWFDDKCGWVLVVDARHGFARLRKIPGRPQAHRGAWSTTTTPHQFTRRRYTLFALTAAVLSDTTRPQISLQDLVDRLQALSTDAVGITPYTPVRHERIALVDAVSLLTSLGILSIVDVEGDYVVNESANVLYDIDDRRLGHLISAPHPPSLATSVAHLLHEDRYGPWGSTSALASGDGGGHVDSLDSPVLTLPALARTRALAATGAPGSSEEQQRRRIRHTIMRILLDDPVLYFDRLNSSERSYLQQTIAGIGSWASEAGLRLERRVEGWAIIDPDDIATDIKFPEGNDIVKFAALLLLSGLQPEGVPAGTVRYPRRAAERIIAARLSANPTWARAYQKDAGGAGTLTTAALELLADFDLAEVDDTGVTLLPAAGRYRPDVADVVAPPSVDDLDGFPTQVSLNRPHDDETP